MHMLNELELELTNDLLYLLNIETDDNSVMIKANQSVMVGSSKKNGKLLIVPKSIDNYRSIPKDPTTTLFRPFSSDKHFKVLIELFMDEFMIDSIETTITQQKQYSTVIRKEKKAIASECHNIKNCSTLLSVIRCYDDLTDEQFEWYKENISKLFSSQSNKRK